MGPDALIMSDPGLIMLVREKWPAMPVHLSVQANAVNYASVRFWAKQGIERVILSRELSLEEIKEIRTQCPETELEVFVHGALRMAYSGRCLLSGYINKRDPNQGTCTNACRWEYDVKPGTENETGEMVHKFDPKQVIPTLGEAAPSNDVFMLEEQGRPGEYMPAFEDEHGTYIMNSKDLRAVQYVEQLTKMGVHSLKIEGRTKSFYYVARTAQVYRRAIDDAAEGRAFNPQLLSELDGMANRGFTEGFLRRHKPQDLQNYDTSHSVGEQLLVGEFIAEQDADGFALLDVKNQFAVGDELILMTPQGNHAFVLQALHDKQGQALLLAPGACYQLKVKLPNRYDVRFAMLLKQLPHSVKTALQPLAVQVS
jgi:putative protease